LGELVHSVVVEQLPEHELICESEPAWKRREGEAVAEQQPPRVSGCEARHVITGMTTWSSRNLASRETLSLPTWHAKCRNGSATLPPVPLQEQPVVVLLLEGALVSWSLAMNERGGHEDLRGSGRRSVISYVHGRTELYCSSLYEPEPFFPTPVKRCLPGLFIAQSRVVIMRPGARQVAPRWLKPYTTSRALMVRSS
jgi:hypothetical protein